MEILKRVEKETLVYTHHTNGVHEFVFTGERRGSLDDFFEIVHNLMTTIPEDETIKYLIDPSAMVKQFSMGELVRRFRQLDAKFINRASARSAVIHNGSIMPILVNTLIETFMSQQDVIRFFHMNNREAAFTWLVHN